MAGIDAYTKLLLHFDGSDEGTDFPDASPSAHALSRHKSGLCTRTAEKKFGSASARSDDRISLLTAPHSMDFALGSQDFAMDCQVLVLTSNTYWQPFLVHGSDPYGVLSSTSLGWSWYLTASGSTYYLRFYYSVTGKKDISVVWTFNSVTQNVWHHLALWRYNKKLYAALDGAVNGTAHAFDVTIYNPALPLQVLGYISNIDKAQALWANGSYGANNAYVDELRLSVGHSRWTTASFSPPTAAYAEQSVTTGALNSAAQLSLGAWSPSAAPCLCSSLAAPLSLDLDGLDSRAQATRLSNLGSPLALDLDGLDSRAQATRLSHLGSPLALDLDGLDAQTQELKSSLLAAPLALDMDGLDAQTQELKSSLLAAPLALDLDGLDALAQATRLSHLGSPLALDLDGLDAQTQELKSSRLAGPLALELEALPASSSLPETARLSAPLALHAQALTASAQIHKTSLLETGLSLQAKGFSAASQSRKASLLAAPFALQARGLPASSSFLETTRLSAPLALHAQALTASAQIHKTSLLETGLSLQAKGFSAASQIRKISQLNGQALASMEAFPAEAWPVPNMAPVALELSGLPPRTIISLAAGLGISCSLSLVERGLSLFCGLRGSVERGLELSCGLSTELEASLSLSCSLRERTPVDLSLGFCCAMFDLAPEVNI